MLDLFKKSPLITAVGIFALVLSISSCKKEEITADTQSNLDKITLVLQTNSSLMRSSVSTGQVNQEKAGGFNQVVLDDRCGAIIAVPADFFTFPKSLTFDYGTGCADAFGIERSGSYKVNLDKIWQAGTTSSIEYTNFKESGVLLNGNLAFANTSGNNGFGFLLTANNLKRTESSGAESTVQTALSFQQTQGNITFWDWTDDVYEITGTSQYALSTGETGALTINTPLTKSNNCAWASKGTATVVINGTSFAIDYGNGTCDNEATVTIGGVSYVIYL